ncbi:MAG TPA: zf-TFIIB domain-containing protein [Myxococcaceae bacterium]|nr:zf-TFIIB domain-containing protein [Myxococcaceae bacterium]
MKLQTMRHGPVEIETCFNCHGIWLDSGELGQLVKKEDEAHPIMEAVLNWFKRK